MNPNNALSKNNREKELVVSESTTNLENIKIKHKRILGKEKEIGNEYKVEAMLVERIEEEIRKVKGEEEKNTKNKSEPLAALSVDRKKSISNKNNAEIQEKHRELRCQNNMCCVLAFSRLMGF